MNIESTLKNPLTPYPPKGGFLNSMIFRCSPLGLGVKHLKIIEFYTIRNGFNIELLKALIMNKLLLAFMSIMMLGPLLAQNPDKLSGEIKKNRADEIGLYALWYQSTANPEQYLQQPYIIGGQMVYQWKDLEPEKGKYDFSKMAQELDKYSKLKIYTTIQINGNKKPDWLFKEVPYHKQKFSVQVRDEKGSLMYWHPTHKQAYINLLKAFAEFVRNNRNGKYLVGIRQNFNGVGTEHLHIPGENRDLRQWIVPEGADKSIPLQTWTEELSDQYEILVLDTYIQLFTDAVSVFVRNNISTALEAKYKSKFESGKLCWFHTSSELEPHAPDVSINAADVELQYKRFYDDCRSGKTVGYAEPWASAWGHHGSEKDDRWCSPPQWFYWTQLNNLHCGVSYIGIYSMDMQVAINGTYKVGDTDYKDDENHTYQKEFLETLNFTNKYVGFHDKLAKSPGAWVAFRENDTILAANGIAKENRKLKYLTGDYNFLMERLPDNSYGKNVTNIGPDENRFGAWARILPPKEQMKFRINPEFIASCQNKNIWVKVTYFDAKGKDFDIIVNNTPHQVTCKGQNKWETKVIEIKDGILKANDKNAQITIQNGSENLYLHMVEVTR